MASSNAAPPLTHRAVLAISVPIIISNVTEPLIGVADTVVLGRSPDPHLIGAAALGSVLFSTLFWAFGFLRMGTTGLTAQAHGAGANKDVASALGRALLIAAAAGVALIGLQVPLASLALELIGGSRDVEAGARAYFGIRIWSAPFALANFALLGWFIGMGRAGTAFVLQLILNLTNIVLDVVLVMGFGMGVEGVALGTLAAEALATGLGCVLVMRELTARGARLAWSDIVAVDGLKRAVSVNGDIMIRTLCLLSVLLFFTAQGARGGDVTLAANAVLFHLFSIASFFLDGFAYAATALVGASIGARDRTRLVAAIRLSTYWAVVLAALLSLVYWSFGGLVIHAMTVSPDIRETAQAYLFWAALTPILGVASFQLDGIFLGATRSRDMRNMMIVSLITFLAAWHLLAPHYGNHGLWAALIVFFVVRALTLGVRLPGLMNDAELSVMKPG